MVYLQCWHGWCHMKHIMIIIMNSYLHLSSMSARFSYSKYKYSRSKLLLFSLSPSPYLPPHLSLSHSCMQHFWMKGIFCLKLSLFHFHTSVISSKVMAYFNHGDHIFHFTFLGIRIALKQTNKQFFKRTV